jgi:hypothetical protein
MRKAARYSLAAACSLIGGALVLALASSRTLELPEQIAVFASAWNAGAREEIVALAAEEDRGRIRRALANLERDGAWPPLIPSELQKAMLAERSAHFASTSRFELERATLVVGWCHDESFEDWELVDLSLTNR